MRRRVEVLRSGADDHLTEPVDAGELVERIRAVRRRRELLSAAPVTGQIRFGGLRVEVEARDVFFDGERVSLSARELDLLVSLARAGGRVCSRAQLLAEVWGVQGLAGSGRLDFYIGSLRAKLGRPGFIQTVRGVGYRLGVLGDL
ncbi:Transcriptional regulatory protein, C terminal [Amycolatopsis pretoriensis]|uniref:Transcriptional regulatory protein, C terminal n=1 Tax=Amycolatopsis pretoriensis TaxID=218821 RepID=A0A1H5RJF2_9PSEU|nr:Transcriptional regulatory protein, C terminal [Amycolatopsis pretoriensis]